MSFTQKCPFIGIVLGNQKDEAGRKLCIDKVSEQKSSAGTLPIYMSGRFRKYPNQPE
jgi:hypothetical protein